MSNVVDDAVNKLFEDIGSSDSDWYEVHTLAAGDVWDYIECIHLTDKAKEAVKALIHRTQVESRLEELQLLLTDSRTNPSHDWNYVDDRIKALEAALEKQA